MTSAVTAKDLVRRLGGRRRKRELPFDGYVDHRTPAPLLDQLSDADLDRLNRLLPWSAFTVDGRGRRFGDAAWVGKRDAPQPIPDRRALLLDERFGLADKHVLEVGCFEGIHTVGLCQRARRVTAVDARIDNVVKTILRTAFYGCSPEVRVCNVEDGAEMSRLHADLVHHVGVLYHLRDPARHLLRLGETVRVGLLLDTHVALAADATEMLEVDGGFYPYWRYREGGSSEVFSGMYEHAKWLTLPGILDLLERAGFGRIDVVEERAERNGPRVVLLAERT